MKSPPLFSLPNICNKALRKTPPIILSEHFALRTELFQPTGFYCWKCDHLLPGHITNIFRTSVWMPSHGVGGFPKPTQIFLHLDCLAFARLYFFFIRRSVPGGSSPRMSLAPMIWPKLEPVVWRQDQLQNFRLFANYFTGTWRD